MNRTFQFVLLGMLLSFVFILLGEGITHVLGKGILNGAIIVSLSAFLGFFVATVIVKPARKL